MAMTSYLIPFTACIVDGEQNQLSKRTYRDGMPVFLACLNSSSIAAVAFVTASWRLLQPDVLLSMGTASFSRFFLLSVERRILLTGRKVLPSDQPRVSIRNPNLQACFAWSYTLARSSAFLERPRSNMESSTIKTFARSSESRGTGPVDDPARKNGCEPDPVNVDHLHETVYRIFCKRRSVPAGKKIHVHASV